MNSDQIQGILRIAVTAVTALLAKNGYIPMVDKDAFSADIVAIITAGLMAWWSHGHIGEVGTAVKKFAGLVILAALLGAGMLTHADAADIATKATAQPAPQNCQSQTSCSGLYMTAGFGGQGSSVDIIGSGLSGSVFANGAEFFIGGGYQYWNGSVYAAVEVQGGWLVPANGMAVSVRDRGYGEVTFRPGYGLQNMFGAPAVPTAFDQLASKTMSGYGIIGARFRSFGSGVESGAGLAYYLGPKMTLSAEYIHVGYSNDGPVNGTVVHTDNGVRLRFQKFF